MQSASCYTKPTLRKIRARTGVVAHSDLVGFAKWKCVFFQKTGYKKQRTSTEPFPEALQKIQCPFIVFFLQSGDSKLWPSKHVDTQCLFFRICSRQFHGALEASDFCTRSTRWIGDVSPILERSGNAFIIIIYLFIWMFYLQYYSYSGTKTMAWTFIWMFLDSVYSKMVRVYYTVCTVLVFVYVDHSFEFASKISIKQL